MEARSHAIITGLFTILLGIALAATFVWFRGDAHKYTEFIVVSKLAVNGLYPQATVRFRGVYVGEDEDSLYAQEQANSLIDLGADVLLDVGDEAPIGALTMAKERGKWGIGSGLDQYQALPGERTILLTSAVKRPDTAVYAFLEQMRQGDLSGTSVEVGTLENGGVGLAPYHDTDRQIPDWLKQEVAEIEEAIQEGKLDTGLQLP